MNLLRLITSALLFTLLCVASSWTADPITEKGAASLPLIDAGGKDVVLTKWKIVFGTQKLAWLPDKIEAFVMREVGSTTFKEGVQTFIPLSQIEAIRYEYDKETVNVQVAGVEKPLQGTIKFKDINTIVLTAEIDQGKSGVADVRYTGGLIKGGFKEVKFPGAKTPTAPPVKGDLFSFQIVPETKGKTGVVMSALNIRGLYRFGDGSEKLLPWLMFKKTLKIDLNDIQRMQVMSYSVKDKTAECEVIKKDDSPLMLTLLGSVLIDDKPATLIGLLGQVEAGWKLFPIHTFTEFQQGEIKVEEKKP